MTPMRGAIVLSRLGRLYLGDSLFGVLARGTTRSFALQVLANVMGVGTQVILARLLSQSDYGVYAYVLGLMNFAWILTKFDFDVTGVKYAAKYTASRDWGLLRGFQRVAIGFTAAFASLVGAVAACAVLWLGPAGAAHLVLPGLVTCAILPLTTIATVQCALLQGRRLIVQSYTQIALRPTVSFALIAIFGGVAGYALDAVKALLIGLVAAVVTIALSTFLLRRASRPLRDAEPRYEHREWLGASAILLPASLAQMTLGTTLDVVVIGTLIDTTSAGVYALASLLLMPAGTVLMSVNTIATPLIAELYARPTRGDLRTLAIMIARVNLALVVPILLTIDLMAPAVLAWFGPSFTAGVPVVLLLSVGAASAIFGGHAAPMLTMTGHHRHASAIIGVSAALNLALALALAPSMGMVGMAVATMLATVVRNVALTIAARRYTGVSLMPM